MDVKENPPKVFKPVAGKLIKLASAGEDDQTHFCIAQNRQLLCLLQ